MGSPVLGPVPGPAPETALAKDMVVRALKVAPLLVLISGVARGLDGMASSAYGIAIVLGNLVLSAALLAWTARISLALLMASALFGYLMRLGLIFLAVLAVRDAPWMDLWALGLTLIVTHLGLLFWEMRYVSMTLAYPGLKPHAGAARRRKSPAIPPKQSANDPHEENVAP